MARRSQAATRRRLAARRAQVATLYNRYCREGNPKGVVRRIAEELGVHHSQIVRDLQALEIDWQATQRDEIAACKARLLADYDRICAESWDEWAKSRTDEPGEQTIEGRPDGEGGIVSERVTKRKRTARGDPRYLTTILGARKQQTDLLGLAAPVRVAGDAGAPVRVEVTDANDPDRIGAILAVLAEAGVLDPAAARGAGGGNDAAADSLHPADPDTQTGGVPPPAAA